ncbi:hypothetical protein L7F22_055592 [Adiantum nelumboides]|nr:hypothetical protein [Adiantum nelumboides]
MVELCAAVEAAISNPNLKLLPLFFKLSNADLKCKENLDGWRKLWTGHAKQESGGKHGPIVISKWEEAVGILCSTSGVVFHDQASEGERAYIDRVVSAVSEIVPPFYNFSTSCIVGKDRLCQVSLVPFSVALNLQAFSQVPPQRNIVLSLDD